MKRILLIGTVLATLLFCQSFMVAQSTTAAPKEVKKTEATVGSGSAKSVNTKKSAKSAHKGRRLHTKNVKQIKKQGPKN